MYVFDRTVLSIICSKCGNNNKIIFKKQESIDIFKIPGLINKIKMDLHCYKCSSFTKNKNVKIKLGIDGKINLYFYCIECDIKKLKLLIKKSYVMY